MNPSTEPLPPSLRSLTRLPCCQVTWIGYPNSTGLRSVDYRFTDAICDPEDTKQTFTGKHLSLVMAGCSAAACSGTAVPRRAAVGMRCVTLAASLCYAPHMRCNLPPSAVACTPCTEERPASAAAPFAPNVVSFRKCTNPCAEELVRLPGCFLCYTPADDAPPVAPLPALTNGFVTFGSFNALAKQTPEVGRGRGGWVDGKLCTARSGCNALSCGLPGCCCRLLARVGLHSAGASGLLWAPPRVPSAYAPP